MSPMLTLVLATALSGAEPGRNPVEMLAVAMVEEFHASLGIFAGAGSDPVHSLPDLSLWYDPATGAELPFARRSAAFRSASDLRAGIAYSTASPVFRDLL